MTPKKKRWVYVRNKSGEQLYYLKLPVGTGNVELPELGSLHYEQTTGNSLHLSVQEPGAELDSFYDGDVIVRSAPGEKPVVARLAQRRKLPQQMFLFVFVCAIFRTVVGIWPASFRASADTKIAPQLSSAPVAAILPKGRIQASVRDPNPRVSAPTRTPTMQATVSPPAKKVTAVKLVDEEEDDERPNPPKRNSKSKRREPAAAWKPLEKEARTLFVMGEWAQSSSLLSDIRASNSGDLPPSLRKFAAEVEYAQCQQSFKKRSWSAATRYCEKAVGYASHARAKKLLDLFSERVRRLYLEAYAMETTNPKAAIRRYKEVAVSAPAANPYRWKATEKLKATRELRVD
ncbi:MAG TPA: hypothetical protein VI895_15185 [Bdellovibrionota bacterium]|nr:hypothetical protein [Bdellovibrionota bacterium]